MTKNEAEIENEIVAKGLTSLRLSPSEIDDCICSEEYHVFSNRRTTACILTLKNGYAVVGDSSCVHSDNFNAEIGRKSARENARNKIWELEGYRLRSKLFEAGSEPAG